MKKINKSFLAVWSIIPVNLVFIFAFLFVGNAFAASTIGTNISTTGTLKVTSDSATAVQFQNAAGTTTVFVVDASNTRVGVNAGGTVNTTFEVGGAASISGVITLDGGQIRPQNNGTTAFRFQNAAGTTSVLVIDTTNFRVGIGTTPVTTFEAQGTASASYFLTGNTIQVGGYSSAAYSRFGTNTATASDIGTTNDLLISGNLEVDLKSYFDAPGEFQGTASASYFLTGNTIQVGGFASAAYSRFGTNSTTHAGTVSGVNDLLISGGLEVNGSAAFDGFALFSLGVSVSTNFEVTGDKRFGINAGAITQASLEVGGTASISGIASVSGNFAAGMGNTGTSSFNFDAPSTSKGSCFRIKDNDGSGYTFLSVTNGVGTFSTFDCR